MARAMDFEEIAQILINSRLVAIEQGRIKLSRELHRLSHVADLSSLKAIARILLAANPPEWLRSAVAGSRLVEEAIPALDRKKLFWLGRDLEAILVAAHHSVYGDKSQEMLKFLGDAGELLIMASLRLMNYHARHVSLVSDHYGYDIEVGTVNDPAGLEIKTSVHSTADRFFLSRNEFEVAQRMGRRWKLIQVIFSSRVILNGYASGADVAAIRQLSCDCLLNLAPLDTSSFQWIEVAKFTPSSSLWEKSAMPVPEDFVFHSRR